MIHSRGTDGKEIARGIALPVRSFSGAVAMRVIERANSQVNEHSHDWPVLSLYVMGACTKHFNGGQPCVNGPSAVLHGAGEPHANSMGAAGLEQIDIQFDPRWLNSTGPDRLKRVHCWRGGRVGAASGKLVTLWTGARRSEAELAAATGEFLEMALGSHGERRPPWLTTILERLEAEPGTRTGPLAREVGLSPGWLTQAYRAAMGEGLSQTIQRRRVEEATILLRHTNCSAAEVATAAGFCDQSHMIRCFKKLLCRTPTEVRAERAALAPEAESSDWPVG